MWEKIGNFFVDAWYKFLGYNWEKLATDTGNQIAHGVRDGYGWVTASWTNAGIVIGSFVLAFLLILIVASLIVTFMSKRLKGPSISKDDFFHKVLRTNKDVKHQLFLVGAISFAIATLVCFSIKNVDRWWTIALACIWIIIWWGRVFSRASISFNRIEYNPRAVYQYKMFNKAKEIKWEDIKDVATGGQGKHRYFMFLSKQNRKIKVKLNMEGGYAFQQYCKEKLTGKQFENIVIAQARQ
jgi:hypothetical protein